MYVFWRDKIIDYVFYVITDINIYESITFVKLLFFLRCFNASKEQLKREKTNIFRPFMVNFTPEFGFALTC